MEVLENLLADAVGAKLFPGAALSLVRGGRIEGRACAGRLGYDVSETAVTAETVYDVASLTKPLVGSLLAGMFVEEGLVTLDGGLAKHLSALARSDAHASITLRHILSHCSGYPALVPLYEGAFDGCNVTPREDLLTAAMETPLEAPPGERAHYSDVGFIVLTALLEQLGGARLDELFRQQVSAPLGLTRTFFIALPKDDDALPVPLAEIAPTARCPHRGRMLRGEVEDENAWALCGVAAHAGLFSTLEDLEKLFLHLRETERGASEILSPETLKTLWEKQAQPAGTTWALGWDTPNPVGAKPSSLVGEKFSRNAVGHWAFTGPSLWYDRERDTAVIFVTNRVHSSRAEAKDLSAFRRALHDAAVEEK